jgi:hypothetical protein
MDYYPIIEDFCKVNEETSNEIIFFSYIALPPHNFVTELCWWCCFLILSSPYAYMVLVLAAEILMILCHVQKLKTPFTCLFFVFWIVGNF